MSKLNDNEQAFKFSFCWKTLYEMDPGTLSWWLTHWGRVTHIYVGKLNIIGSDNGLSPGQRQAIIWTNDRILSIRPLATNFNETLIGIQTSSFKKMYLKMSSAKWCPFCLGLNVLKVSHVHCQSTSSTSWQSWSPGSTQGSRHHPWIKAIFSIVLLAWHNWCYVEIMLNVTENILKPLLWAPEDESFTIFPREN